MYVKRTNRILLWFNIAWAAMWSRSNRIFYDRISSIYDEVYVAHRVHAESVLKILQNIFSTRPPKTSVLDLGCGTGMLSLMLVDNEFNVAGLDISFPALCILRQQNSKVNVIQAEAGFLPIPDESFDAVVCLGAWRHFMDTDKILEEICRVLNRDGVFIVGYFPPAIAGIFNVKDNILGNSLIWLYHLFTKRLRYFDRVDFSFERETEKAIQGQFKTFCKEESESNKHILIAHKPLTRAKDFLSQGPPEPPVSE